MCSGKNIWQAIQGGALNLLSLHPQFKSGGIFRPKTKLVVKWLLK